MSQKIERDHQRFRKIVRGKVKSNLGKYISRGEMIGKKGKDLFMPLRLALTGVLSVPLQIGAIIVGLSFWSRCSTCSAWNSSARGSARPARRS